jgi:7-cyano-7-deazaguanine synthase
MAAESPKAVVLLSGGMDSTTLVHLLQDEGYLPYALSIKYGQRHSIELDYAYQTVQGLGIPHQIIDIKDVKELIGTSALTRNEIQVPEGHYAAENMAVTVVPNRNAFLLSIAYGWAVSLKAVKVCTAVHKGDHAIYPDCRPEFIKAFEEMERTAITREIYGIKCPDLYAPFVHLSKAEICAIGAVLDVDWRNTWSCYQGGTKHCGRCGTCVERIEAFKLAGVVDPTEYLDSDFAATVLT